MKDGLLELPTDTDEQKCLKCGQHSLDTGWECTECEYDNMPWYYPEGSKKLATKDPQP